MRSPSQRWTGRDCRGPSSITPCQRPRSHTRIQGAGQGFQQDRPPQDPVEQDLLPAVAADSIGAGWRWPQPPENGGGWHRRPAVPSARSAGAGAGPVYWRPPGQTSRAPAAKGPTPIALEQHPGAQAQSHQGQEATAAIGHLDATALAAADLPHQSLEQQTAIKGRPGSRLKRARVKFSKPSCSTIWPRPGQAGPQGPAAPKTGRPGPG